MALCSFALFPKSVFAEFVRKDDSLQVSPKNLQAHLERFVREPHPMGSDAQRKLGADIKKYLAQVGLKASAQEFDATVPNSSATEKSAKQIKVRGVNVIGIVPGTQDCVIIFGGHYDTKWLPKFVGANDGGSSTALLLELARVVQKERKTKPAPRTWQACDQAFVFFDGEEAQLEDWSEGEKRFGIVDHLYGSRHFVSQLKEKKGVVLFNGKPVKLVVVVDMVGHKNQKLLATSGSYEIALNQILKVKGNTSITATSTLIEDDHVPFRERGVRFVHLIDWFNLEEWHTEKDTLEIVSAQKIAELGEVLRKFLKSEMAK